MSITRLVLLTILLLSPAALAQQTLNPATYDSPLGEYQLSVNPTHREGRGEGNYTLTRAGQADPIWSGKLPFTLWEAVVTDDGTFVGYAYNLGHRGSPRREETSSIIIAIIRPDGTILAQHAHERSFPNFQSNPPSPLEPVAQGIILDQTNDRFIVRATQLSFQRENPITWWTYRLSTGEEIASFHPEGPEAGEGFIREIETRLLPGTPLVLVHWYSYTREGGNAHFGLINPAGQRIWRHEIEGDYDNMQERWNWPDLLEEGAGQVELTDRGFAILSYRHQERITFEVVQDPDGDWAIGQLATEPATVPTTPDREPGLKPIELPLLGEITLGTVDEARPEIHNVRDFGIDSEGRLGFIRASAEADQPAIFLVLTAEGEILSRTELPFLAEETRPTITLPQPGGRWLVIDTGLGDRAASVHRIDPATGDVERIIVDVGGIREAAAFPDGGFVALAGNDWLYARQPMRFGPDGKRLWDKPSPGTVQDIAITSDRKVVVLTGIQNNLEFYSEAGEHLRTLPIQQVIGRRPNYPSGLEADVDGGLILHDFNGNPPIYRIKADDEVLAEFLPRWPDDREFRIFGGVAAAPGGTLWTADGNRFLVLDGDGQVRRHIGPDPHSTALAGIRAMAVDRRGWFYAIDEETAAVHIFDETGARQRIFLPDPTDFSTDTGLGHITVAHDGGFYYYPQHTIRGFEGTRHLHVDARGERIGLFRRVADSVREVWYCKPADPGIWAVGYEEIRLLNAERKIVKTINRRPNDQWIGITGDAAVAPDGSLAVITEQRDGGMGFGPATICIFGPGGEPRQAIALGDMRHPRLAFTGRFVAAVSANELRLYDLNANNAFVFSLPGTERPWWTVHAAPDGSELLLRESGAVTIQRYGLPQ